MTLRDLKEQLNNLPDYMDDFNVVFGYVYPTLDVGEVCVTNDEIELGM